MSMDYDTIVNALFMGGNEYNRCTGCGKMTLDNKLSSGRCDICSSPAKKIPIVASLDMDAIIEKVSSELVDAGMLDMFRKKRPKTIEQILEEQRMFMDNAAEKTEDQGYKDMQKGIAAPWKELRKRFPKK